MKIDAERLRGFLDCMHNEADERDKISVRIREIVKAAKDAGYDTKAVRKVFVRERMDESERVKQDDLLETYEAALGPKGSALRAIEAGAKVGEAADAAGVHRATVARARYVAKQASIATEPAHDPDTGEITETAAVKQPGESSRHDRRPDGPGSALATHSETRSPAFSASDSTEPVEPTGNEGWAGERNLSCGDGESRPVPALPESNRTDESRDPMLRRVGSEQSPSSTKALPETCEASRVERVAGVAPGPQDPVSDATPCGCVDGEATPVPPVSTSQADGVAAPPATPASTTGIGVGTFADAAARVVPSATAPRFDPYEEAPPAFLDQRHKARATG